MIDVAANICINVSLNNQPHFPCFIRGLLIIVSCMLPNWFALQPENGTLTH